MDKNPREKHYCKNVILNLFKTFRRSFQTSSSVKKSTDKKFCNLYYIQEKKKAKLIDDIGVGIIAMHYGIGWGKRQRVFLQDFPSILWEYSLSWMGIDPIP